MTRTTPAEVRTRPIREVSFDRLPSAPGEPPHSLIPLKATGDGTPVFLVHGGYGQVFHFKRLAERLRDDIPLYGLEARGTRDGQEPVNSISEMASNYIDEIKTIRPHGPYLIGGFSFGGWIAWEIAQQLRRAGDDVRLLMIDIGPMVEEEQRPNLAVRLGRIASFHWRNWRGLEGKSRSAYRVEALRGEFGRVTGALGLDPTRMYGLAMKLGPKRQPTAARLLVGAIGAMDDWDFEPLDRPVTLFRAELQPPTGPQHPTMGLTDEICQAGLEVRPVPGSHSFIFVVPHVNTLTAEFERWFDIQEAETVGAPARRTAVAEAASVADD